VRERQVSRYSAAVRRARGFSASAFQTRPARCAPLPASLGKVSKIPKVDGPKRTAKHGLIAGSLCASFPGFASSRTNSAAVIVSAIAFFRRATRQWCTACFAGGRVVALAYPRDPERSPNSQTVPGCPCRLAQTIARRRIRPIAARCLPPANAIRAGRSESKIVALHGVLASHRRAQFDLGSGIFARNRGWLDS